MRAWYFAIKNPFKNAESGNPYMLYVCVSKSMSIFRRTKELSNRVGLRCLESERFAVE